ncbi:hypothetical protein [Chryseobacterium sp. 5_R23647]|uniref:hypothetical protein n=1 Tax=Chryseobacterium sp. 5_R23647 TaxID=2258964 RepID=UPI000E27898B|nr:hypothetical protein [Chryseobacterium sp. 5_R23647]REC42559.1 hypothetical protein DRF69_10900 [Chryseobacterium sp. 5_R23647]
MQTEHLPTEDLKKFGIINEDLSFSKNLKADDIQKFFQGYTIVADNGKNRATFQLTENNTKLKVIFLERDKSISEIIENSKEKIEYSNIQNLSNENEHKRSLEKKAFIYDNENNIVAEFDLIKNATELTAIIVDKKDVVEMNRYKNELQKLKNFLMDKMDQYPEIAKEISNELNIVSREINTVNSISPDEKQISKGGNSESDLNVNDRDRYEDANRNREEQEEEIEQEQEKHRGFRR